MALAIETRHLAKRYRAHIAVKNISLKIKEGEIFSILGPNGAGKSTTIGMLTTAIRPSSGTAEVLGHTVVTEPQEIRKSIGVVFQHSILDTDLSARTNLNFQARLHGVRRPERYHRIDEAIKLAGLQHRSRIRVDHLSGGMQRRLEIARALVHHPKILFLDEPTTGLDLDVRKYIWDKLDELRNKRKLTIILTTHYLEEADRLADRVAIIDSGEIKAQGTPQRLKKMLGDEIVTANLEQVSPTLKIDLEKLNGLQVMKQSNGKISFQLAGANRRVPEIINVLQRNAKKIKSFQLKEPSLEDVFLAVAGHSMEREDVEK